MIKIIEENWYALLGVCPYCLSKFTLEEDDLIYLYSRSDIQGVVCPVCSMNVTSCDIKRVPKKEIEKLNNLGDDDCEFN